MSVLELNENIEHLKEILREMYVFTNQYNAIINLENNSESKIDLKEKKLLTEAIDGLNMQLRIINDSIPGLVENMGFFKKFESPEKISTQKPKKEPAPVKLIKLKYHPSGDSLGITLTINEKDRKRFLENLSKTHLSINLLKKKYAIEKPAYEIGRPSFYIKFSNKFFRETSNKLVLKGYFNGLNHQLRKINSQMVIGSYVSMMLLTVLLTFLISIILMLFLLFYKLDFSELIIPYTGDIYSRFLNVFWVIIALPGFIAFMFLYYPKSEANNIGARIDQELPFITIHMSAIASSGIEPISVFKIILKNEEYKYTNMQFRKIMNLINFHGYDLVTALKEAGRASPSLKLGELFEGLATAINSGGNLHEFLNERADTLLFDYKLDREKQTKAAETFMNIYISVVIAAPMILLILFVIMGGSNMMGGLAPSVAGLIISLIVAAINVFFLVFLHLKNQ